MNPTPSPALNLVAVIGLALGGVFGLAGTFVASEHLQTTLWLIDSVGLVVAASLLSLKFFRKDRDFVAAGFLVFAIGEAVLLSGTAAGRAESMPSFAAGVALWAAALLLISLPREFALSIRVVGVVAAVLFAVTAARIFGGEALSPISKPLPFFAYPFLVLNFAGWIWTLVREGATAEAT